METDDSGGKCSAGPGGPAREALCIGCGEKHQLCEKGEECALVEVTAAEQAVISRLLGKCGGRANRGGRAASVVGAALKLVALLLGGGVVAGYADGDDMDDVGCTVAQQPGEDLAVGHHGHAERSGEHGGDKVPGSSGGPSGRSSGGRPPFEALAEKCVHRMPCGLCGITHRRCRVLGMEREERTWQSATTERKDRSAFGSLGEAGHGALTRIEGKVEEVLARLAAVGTGPALAEGYGAVNESEARRVFVLMKRLEGGTKQRKAPLPTVFRLTVLEGQSQAETARLCRCVPALISRRVKTIESRFGMSIERLRNFASAILEMEASVKGGRARKLKGGALQDEAAQDDDGAGQPDVVDDGGGYLPEEGQEACE